MSKKTIYTIISIFLVLVLLVLVSFYLFTGTNTDGTSKTPAVFRNFFPFGGNDNTNNNSTTTPVQDETPKEPVNFVVKLRKLTENPVAGSGLLDVKAGTVVRYIEKATGHIFEVELFSPRQGRISNTTIPKVYDAVWGNKNNSLITRYLKEDDYTVDTYSLNIKDISTTTENTISGIALPTKISDVSVFGASVFYLTQNDTSSYGYISNFSGGAVKQVWNSPIKELLSQYVNSRTVALTTKPDQGSEGLMYFVDPTNGVVKKIIGNIFGLSTLVNDDASQVLYLDQSGIPSLKLYEIKNRGVKSVTPVTFPEKCAWSKKDRTIVFCAVPREFIESNSLSLWYMGQSQLTDDVWKIDLKNNTSSIVLNLSNESGENIDVIKPILSENEQYLVFINKRDDTLWSLDLTK